MSSEYFQELLRFYITKSTARPAQNSPQIVGRMLESIMKWIYDVCEQNRYSLETFQLASEILVKFLSVHNTTSNTLQLVAVASLMLSVKYHEKSTLSLLQASQVCLNKYSLSDIQITERFILQRLDWGINMPTASEISRAFLLATGVTSDFSRIFERSDGFAVICYMDFKLLRFSALEIAITSTVCALEQFNQLQFRNQWLELLRSRVNFDLARVDECKRLLVEYLLLTTSVNDRNKIECLLRESISSLFSSKDR